MADKLLSKYKALPRQVKASFWFLICSFLQKGISMITTPIFTRLLSPDEYGRYSVFNSWLSLITVFVTLNLFYGVYSRGLITFDKERNSFSSSMQGLTLTLTVFWTVVYLLFREFFNNLFSLTTTQMLAMLVMIWASAVFSFWATEQRVKLNYVKLVVISLAVSFVKPLVGVIVVINAEDKVTARILGLMVVELAAYTGMFVSHMIRGRKFFVGKFWKHALRFNIPLVPHYLSQSALNSADRIMIENMVSSSAAGIYSVAYSVSMIMTLFNSALSQTMSPWIYQKIKDKKSGDIALVAYGALMIIAVVNLALIAFAPEIVAIFAPPSYGDAIWVIPPVAMSVYFKFAYDLFAKFQFYYGKTGFIMLASVMAAAANIILNYIFIGLYGYYAAGYTTLICYMLYTMGHYYFMRKVCKENMNGEKVYNLKILLVITLLFLALGFLFLAVYKIMIARYILILLILAALATQRKRLTATISVLMKKTDR